MLHHLHILYQVYPHLYFEAMANSTYDNMWQQAMGELSEQLHVEGVDDGDDGEGGGSNQVSSK